MSEGSASSGLGVHALERLERRGEAVVERRRGGHEARRRLPAVRGVRALLARLSPVTCKYKTYRGLSLM